MIYDRNNLPDDIKNLPDADFEPLHQEDIKDEKFKTKPVGFFKDAMIRLSKNRVSMISGAIILLIVLMAIIVPNITGYSYTEQNVAQQNLPPKIPGLEKLGIFDGSRVLTDRRKDKLDDTDRYPEGCIIEIFNEHDVKNVTMCDVKVDYYKYSGVADGEYHWLGTDYLGRDLLTRLFRGAHIAYNRRGIRCGKPCDRRCIRRYIRLLRRQDRYIPYAFGRGFGRHAVRGRYHSVHVGVRRRYVLHNTCNDGNGLDRHISPYPRPVLSLQGP